MKKGSWVGQQLHSITKGISFDFYFKVFLLNFFLNVAEFQI